MIGRLSILIVVFVLGVGSASVFPSMRRLVGVSSEPSAARLRPAAPEQQKSDVESPDRERIKLTDEQIAATRIDVVPAQHGTLSRRITVPGTIIPVADRIARVS